MPRIEVYIPTKEEVKKLKRLAKDAGQSVSEFVRVKCLNNEQLYSGATNAK